MKRFLLTTALALVSSGAMAQVVDDPLHLCYTTGCSPFGGVTIFTGSPPPNLGGLANWGFSSSPPSQTGHLVIAILIPANEAELTFPTITGQLSGSPLGFSAITDVGLFGPGQDLTTVLGIPASPPNPYGAYAGATAMLDSGFTAGVTKYIALEVSVNGSTFDTGTQGGQTTVLDNTFALAGGKFQDGSLIEKGLPDGTIVTGFLEEAGKTLSTAQSSSLALDTFAAGVVPEPSTWAMFIAGFGLMGLIGWRRSAGRAAASCSTASSF